MSGWQSAASRGRGVVETPTRLIGPGLRGFKQFLMRGNIVDLAVAVVIGTAFTAVVKSLVDNMFTPLIAAIGGEPDFSQLHFKINGSVFNYGQFLNDVISFLVVAAVIYFVIVLPIAKANEMRRRGEPQAKADEPAVSDETRLLTEIRDLLAAGNGPAGGGIGPAGGPTYTPPAPRA
ncbi:large conductance mechanosensitive channel protein MscL [Parafrankia sp. EUN1f]|uniref:large conductance mechanosensitive channel protein MscL n=1 Tax=Parafrankia sp. EUN1f TaxID=102897 RepID=UPI0001C44DC8|nr:large conductance mechanosensitive channel protein MscL [Parafrankia sp. EUN1f]EFC84693.1 large conductance mechanosensitive channel protein [Parafrankia sp. EUN1f]